MEKNTEPWKIAAARFCAEKVEFTLKELEDFLKNPPYNIPHQHVRIFFTENIQSPPGYKFNREFRTDTIDEGNYWTAPVELVSMVTDHDELKEARKNAKNAWWISMAAFVVSALGALFQYLSL